jgi:hypothetical protein
MRGIVGGEKVLSAQLKGSETVVAGIEGSKRGTVNELERGMAGDEVSVCVDMDAVEDGGMIRGDV